MNSTLLHSNSLFVIVMIMSVAPVVSFKSTECPHRLQSTLGMGKRMDITDSIKTALTVSNKFGAASYKAILAWKSVEDIEQVEDIKVKIPKSVNHTLCIEDYEEILNGLKPLLKRQETKTQNMKSLVNEIKVSVSRAFQILSRPCFIDYLNYTTNIFD